MDPAALFDDATILASLCHNKTKHRCQGQHK